MISGRCDPAFGAVGEAFAANFAEQGEVGAAVCVMVDGDVVVDLVGGWADQAARRPWLPTTMVDFYLPRHPEMEERARTRLSRMLTAVWAVVLLLLAILSRTGGHVVEIGLSIASVTWGEMLGAFLLGTLTRRATQNGTIVGMIIGVIVNLILWQQPGPFAVGHSWALPKVAFIWYVLIGAMITTTVGYIASLLLPQQERATAA